MLANSLTKSYIYLFNNIIFGGGRQDKAVAFSRHAFSRLVERSWRYGLSPYEARRRAIQAVRAGNLSKRKHLARKPCHNTYCHYFKDGLSFYVICHEREFEGFTKYLVKTIIIERGRE